MLKSIIECKQVFCTIFKFPVTTCTKKSSIKSTKSISHFRESGISLFHNFLTKRDGISMSISNTISLRGKNIILHDKIIILKSSKAFYLKFNVNNTLSEQESEKKISI